MKNILILASATGGGHLSAAKALQSLLDSDKYNSAISTDLDTQAIFHRIVEWYKTLQQYPSIWRFIYYVSQYLPFKNIFFTLFAKRIFFRYHQILERYTPDLIISMHPLMQSIAVECAKEWHVPSMTIVLDPYTPHPIWLNDRLNYIIVPFEETREFFQKRTHFKGNMNVVTFPVRKEFLSAGMEKIEEIFTNFGLQKQYTITVSSGGDGYLFRHYKEEILEFARKHSDINIIIICGTNKILKTQVDSMIMRDSLLNIKTFGFTDQIRDILLISDVHIMKAGPNTLFETLATDTVPYIYAYLPGQEYGNSKKVEEEGIGLVEKFPILLERAIIDTQKKGIYREKISQFMQKTKIYEEEELFNASIDSILNTNEKHTPLFA